MEILEIQLYTGNLASTKLFYGHAMGLEILLESETELQFNAGQTLLVFKQSAVPIPPYHFAFNIPCNCLRKAIDWLNELGIALLPVEGESVVADFTNWNAESVYFLDSNQNILEFIARKDLHNESTESFSKDLILNISEMGIVADAPLVFAEKLANDYTLEYFSKQAPADMFCAMGNDNGLFVIPKSGRNWYPTQVAAIPAPFSIRFKPEETSDVQILHVKIAPNK